MERTEYRKKKNYHKYVVRQIISYILAFILSVCLTLITLMLVVGIGFFNENNLYKYMRSCGYYDYVYTDIMADIKSMTIPTGFPESICDGIITQTHIYNDINGSLKAQFNGAQYTSRASEIKQQLYENINKYLEENEYTVTEDENAAIDKYLDSVSTNYDKYIEMPLGNYLIQIKSMFSKMFWIVIVVLLVVSAVIVYVIFLLYRRIYKALSFYTYTVLGCAVMVTCFPAYLYIEKIYYRFSLSPESFYRLVTTCIDNILELFMCFGGLWFVVAMVFICIMVSLKRYNKSK